MVVPHAQATRDVFGEAAEMLSYSLAERLERLEAGGLPIGMDADALGGKMIDGDEHRRSVGASRLL